MVASGCYKFMKYTLMVFNILVLIAGCIAIGLGAWTLASDYGAQEMKDITGSQLYEGVAIAVIVGGCIIVVIAAVGCFGAWMENRIALGIYFVIMLLLLILFVLGAALGFAFRDDIEDELKSQMEDTLTKDYGVDEYGNRKDNAIMDGWDKLQENLDCCGVSGDFDGRKSWFLWQQSKWFEAMKNLSNTALEFVPRSCCNILKGTTAEMDNMTMQCTRYYPNTDTPIKMDNDFDRIKNRNNYLHEKGCVDKLKDEIENHIVAVAGIALALLIILFLSVMFSVCVCVEIGRHEGKNA